MQGIWCSYMCSLSSPLALCNVSRRRKGKWIPHHWCASQTFVIILEIIKVKKLQPCYLSLDKMQPMHSALECPSCYPEGRWWRAEFGMLGELRRERSWTSVRTVSSEKSASQYCWQHGSTWTCNMSESVIFATLNSRRSREPQNKLFFWLTRFYKGRP